jgi:electron transfer flavoprotein alpha subunit
MAEVLVYVDHVDGAVRKPTLELLTLARRIGGPVAVALGSGAENTARALAVMIECSMATRAFSGPRRAVSRL